MTISSIFITITTDAARDSGTDGSVYLGIGGREFNCDTSADDRETGDVNTYTFGEGSNVSRPAANDPRNPPIKDEWIDRFPVYLRFQSDGGDHWALRRAQLTINGELVPRYEFLIPTNSDPLWLGPKSGCIAYLIKHDDRVGAAGAAR